MLDFGQGLWSYFGDFSRPMGKVADKHVNVYIYDKDIQNIISLAMAVIRVCCCWCCYYVTMVITINFQNCILIRNEIDTLLIFYDLTSSFCITNKKLSLIQSKH